MEYQRNPESLGSWIELQLSTLNIFYWDVCQVSQISVRYCRYILAVTVHSLLLQLTLVAEVRWSMMKIKFWKIVSFSFSQLQMLDVRYIWSEFYLIWGRDPGFALDQNTLLFWEAAGSRRGISLETSFGIQTFTIDAIHCYWVILSRYIMQMQMQISMWRNRRYLWEVTSEKRYIS